MGTIKDMILLLTGRMDGVTVEITMPSRKRAIALTTLGRTLINSIWLTFRSERRLGRKSRRQWRHWCTSVSKSIPSPHTSPSWPSRSLFFLIWQNTTTIVCSSLSENLDRSRGLPTLSTFLPSLGWMSATTGSTPSSQPSIPGSRKSRTRKKKRRRIVQGKHASVFGWTIFSRWCSVLTNLKRKHSMTWCWSCVARWSFVWWPL